MNKNAWLLGALMLLTSWGAVAQSDDRVLFSVNGDAVSVQEFLSVYNKNNYSKKAPTADDLKEYLELYVRFKLKVQEAYQQGLDTTQKFKRELDNYRSQLAQPYLRDKETNQSLLQEAYARTQTERRASHIMVKIEENASPADSLVAYKKALQIRERLLKGEDFNKVAKEVSEDPSAKDNAGDLGFFSAFRMIYPFEDMAYKTPVGGLSPVFRTQYGYHVLKVTGERAARGEIRVAHLMLVNRNTDTDSIKDQTRRRIMELHRRIQAGENFEQLVAQFSEDPSSSQQQGLLPYFGTGRMVPEFEEAAYALKNNGDISAPVQTAYGWHILKRVDLRSIPTFEQARADLESRIARDSRANINKANLLAKLKKEYKFTENAKSRAAVFASVVDTSYRSGSWKTPEFKKDEVVFAFADRKFTQSELAAHLKTQSGLIQSADLAIFLNNTYQKWVDEQLLAYEDSRLETKHADFRALMKEYREGILLFDLTDQMVWSKAVTDTDGLSAFYATQGDKYMYKARLDADVYTLTDAKSAKSLRKEIGKKKNTHDKLLAKYNKTNPLGLKINSGKFEKGALPVLDKVEWKAGISEVIEFNGQFVVVRAREVLAPSVKPLNEVRGLVTSDYQQYLERNWIRELENKYQVVINRETFNSILPQ